MRQALVSLDGVADAQVLFEEAQAIVTYHPAVVDAAGPGSGGSGKRIRSACH